MKFSRTAKSQYELENIRAERIKSITEKTVKRTKNDVLAFNYGAEIKRAQRATSFNHRSLAKIERGLSSARHKEA